MSPSNEPISSIVVGAGPGLVLTHGSGGSIEANLGPVLTGLSDHFTVVGPDYPGLGTTHRSSAPLSLDGLADAAVAAADEAGLGTFSLVGCSMGSPVAIRVTTRYPRRVDRLALVAGFAKPDRYLRLVLDLWHNLIQADSSALGEFLVALGAGEQVVSSLTDPDVADLVSRVAASVPAEAIDHVALARTIDVEAELADIAVPTLVVQTVLDKLATPPHSAVLAAAIPDARLVELDCEHLMAAERHQQLLNYLVDHLRPDSVTTAL
ncbi:alpha/beta fold hydrolase [Nocardia sp. NPDC001965]